MQTDPHTQHCCALHGCRFGNDDKCAVVQGKAKQTSRCGESPICSEFTTEEDPDYYNDSYESYQD